MSEAQMEAFVKTSDEVANNLKERYKDQWIDPKDDRNTQTEWIWKWKERNQL